MDSLRDKRPRRGNLIWSRRASGNGCKKPSLGEEDREKDCKIEKKTTGRRRSRSSMFWLSIKRMRAWQENLQRRTSRKKGILLPIASSREEGINEGDTNWVLESIILERCLTSTLFSSTLFCLRFLWEEPLQNRWLNLLITFYLLHQLCTLNPFSLKTESREDSDKISDSVVYDSSCRKVDKCLFPASPSKRLVLIACMFFHFFFLGFALK